MFKVTNLHKVYDKGEKEVRVLTGLDFSCGRGEFIGIFGASGAGKSSFLHVIGGLDRPTEGEIKFNGVNLYEKNGRFLANFRNREVGFVFQFYHLLSEFSAVENVMLSCLIGGINKKKAFEMSAEALSHVGMIERKDHRPSELSGGEQQRVAVARAIVMKPKFILADEPTGNLDEASGLKVFSYFESLYKETGTGIIMVTHNPDLLKKIPKKLELKGGILHEVEN